MNELRLFIRRDSLQGGTGCPWAWLDGSGRVQRSGSNLDALPSVRRCRLVLAADMVLTLAVDLPDLPARKLSAMLPAAAEAATLEDAEQLHTVLLGDKPGGSSRLAVVRKAWLERLLVDLHGRELRPDQALPEFLLLPWNEGEWSVLLHEDGIVARFGEYDGAALDQGDPPAGLRLALAAASPPKRIRLYQGTALNRPDAARWSEILNLPVEFAGAWDWREAPWNEAGNVLTGTFAAARSHRDWRVLARPLIGGLALLAGLQLFGIVLDWASQTREQANIRSESRTLAEKVLPAHAALVDPAWQVGEQLRGMRAAAGGGGPDSALALLARLGQAWPPGSSPLPSSMNLSAREMEISLAQMDDAWFEQLKNAGAARGLSIVMDKGNAGQTLLRVRPVAAKSGDQP